jgi:hypothetical protein
MPPIAEPAAPITAPTGKAIPPPPAELRGLLDKVSPTPENVPELSIPKEGGVKVD